MGTPDKIYFPADGLPSYIDWDGSPIRTKQVEDSDVCYIRKDAVLELLQKRNKEINGEPKAIFRSKELQEIYWRINEL